MIKAIEIKNLNKYYNKGLPTEIHALSGVDLSINQGEMIAVMGVSGSGKSTLLHILGFLDKYDDGDYLFYGESKRYCANSELAKIRNKDIGFVLQDFGLILGKSVYDNIAIPLLLNPDIKYKEISSKIDNVLNQLDLTDKKYISVELLSGGQQQRVAIARAIINSPRLLIADEPTGALDSKNGANIMKIFQELNRIYNMTIVIATHDKSISDYCNKTLWIEDGKISIFTPKLSTKCSRI